MGPLPHETGRDRQCPLDVAEPEDVVTVEENAWRRRSRGRAARVDGPRSDGFAVPFMAAHRVTPQAHLAGTEHAADAMFRQGWSVRLPNSARRSVIAAFSRNADRLYVVFTTPFPPDQYHRGGGKTTSDDPVITEAARRPPHGLQPAYAPCES